MTLMSDWSAITHNTKGSGACRSERARGERSGLARRAIGSKSEPDSLIVAILLNKWGGAGETHLLPVLEYLTVDIAPLVGRSSGSTSNGPTLNIVAFRYAFVVTYLTQRSVVLRISYEYLLRLLASSWQTVLPCWVREETRRIRWLADDLA